MTITLTRKQRQYKRSADYDHRFLRHRVYKNNKWYRQKWQQ